MRKIQNIQNSFKVWGVDTAALSNEKRHHGLGLAVAKEIVTAHKGSLNVSEADGGGALFILTLPIRHLPSAS